MTGALDGIRVLDATQMLAGPMAGMRFGDLGADVIKIEPPTTGEFNRTHGYAGAEIDGWKTTFLGVNRNKRSLAIDLKHPEGKGAFLKLVKTADVFIQNFRPGVTERLGIGYDTLHELNPRLVYTSISGYGSTGPGAARPGQDLVMQGYSGSMWFVGSKNDPPTPGGIPSIDVMTGYQAVIGALAALHSRDKTGHGQHVEVDMLSVVMDAQVQELVTYLNTDIVPPQRGTESSAHAWIGAPYGVYKTKDSWLTLAMCPVNVLGQALGTDELQRFIRLEDAQKHADEIYAIIRPMFAARTTSDWMSHFDTFNIWSGPVHDYPALEKDAQVVARGMITEMNHPTLGVLRTVAPPIRLSETPTSIRSAPPALGSDSREILAGVGFDNEAISRLAELGVIRDAKSEK